MSERFSDSQSEDSLNGMWTILERPKNTLDHNGNEIDVVELKQRFRGPVGSPNYHYLLDVASAAGLEVAYDMFEYEQLSGQSAVDDADVKTKESFAYTAAQMAAHYATWMQWVVNLPGEQWPKDNSEPEFFTWAEEAYAKLKDSENN